MTLFLQQMKHHRTIDSSRNECSNIHFTPPRLSLVKLFIILYNPICQSIVYYYSENFYCRERKGFHREPQSFLIIHFVFYCLGSFVFIFLCSSPRPLRLIFSCCKGLKKVHPKRMPFSIRNNHILPVFNLTVFEYRIMINKR